MLCFAAMTIEKAEIFIPEHKSKMLNFLGCAAFRIYQIIKIVASAYL